MIAMKGGGIPFLSFIFHEAELVIRALTGHEAARISAAPTESVSFASADAHKVTDIVGIATHVDHTM